MTGKIKIVILGIGQSNFLDQLYGGIAKKTDQFTFEIDGYNVVSTGISQEKPSVYHQHFNSKKLVIPKQELYTAFLSFVFTSFFWQILFFELGQGSKIRSVIAQLKKYASAKYSAENLIIRRERAIYHFHFCTPENLIYLHFLPKDALTVCSFWGSDLMRNNGERNIFYVAKALKRAKSITIQTPELGAILLDKYGSEFQSKLHFLRFTINEEIYNEIDLQRQNYNSALLFKKEYNIPPDNMIVALGHNAFPENNHLKMLQSLANLSEVFLDKITFILHLGYGGSEKYIQQLIEFGQNHPALQIINIRKYFGAHEMAQLRIATDVLVQMPVSDALSGAMTEVLYAGNIVLAGSWLPYGILRQNGIHYDEVRDFDEIATRIVEVSKNLIGLKERNLKNRERIQSLLFPDATTPEWIALYNKLL